MKESRVQYRHSPTFFNLVIPVPAHEAADLPGLHQEFAEATVYTLGSTVILQRIYKEFLSMGKWVNFNTIFGKLYDTIFDDSGGDSYLSINKTASKMEPYISVSKHFEFV